MSVLVAACLLTAYTVPYLTQFTGAQQTAMAGAYVAISEDAYANLYNPAGLGFQRRPSLALEYGHVPWEGHAYAGDIATAVPLNRWSTLGAYVNRYRRFYKTPSPEYGHSEDNVQQEAGVNWGIRPNVHVGLGIGLKHVYLVDYYWDQGHGVLQDDTAGAVAWDLGGLWKVNMPIGTCGLGVTFRHVPTFLFLPEALEPLPTTLRAGVAYIVTVPDLLTTDAQSWMRRYFRLGKDGLAEYLLHQWRLALAYDMNYTLGSRHGTWDETKEKPRHSLGVEVRPVPFFALRLGYYEDMTNPAWDYAGGRGWTLGMGLDLKYFRLDIADDNSLYAEAFDSRPFRIRFTLSGTM